MRSADQLRLEMFAYALENPLRIRGKPFCPLKEACPLYRIQRLGSIHEKIERIDEMGELKWRELVHQHDACVVEWLRALRRHA